MALTRTDVQRAFQNSLGRSALQADEDAFFFASQNGGASDIQLYTAISNSREADIISDPIVRFYQAAFGRVPDAAGLDNWQDYIRANGPTQATYIQVATLFSQQPEFQARYGGGDVVDGVYVQSLYRDILGRFASLAELDGYVSGSSGYTTRGGVLYAISQSQEAITASNAAVNAFLLDAAEGDARYLGSLYPDTVPPSVSISLANTNLVAGQTTQVTFDFSEAVSGFDQSDLQVTRGSLSQIVQSASDATVYTATFTANAGAGTGSIALTGAYTDAAGNPGQGGRTDVTVTPAPSGPPPIDPNLAVVFTANKVGFNTAIAADSVERTIVQNGNDTIIASGAQLVGATIAGQGGTDTLNITGGGTANLSLATVTGLENVTLAAATTFTAGIGAFAIAGSTGADTVVLGASATQSYAANGGNDTITLGAAGQIVTGGAGNETVNATAALLIGSTLSGAGGAADVLTVTAAPTADLNLNDTNGATAGNPSVSGFETINLGGTGSGAFTVTTQDGAGVTTSAASATGSYRVQLGSGGQTYNASAFGDFVIGGSGRDTINGGAGNDTLSGGAGADRINVGLGANVVFQGNFDGVDDTGTDLTLGANNAALDTGDRVSFGNGVDLVFSMKTGDRLQFFQGVRNVPPSTNGGIGNTEYYTIRGIYDEASQIFTINTNSGPDTLVRYDSAPTAATSGASIILIGVTNTTNNTGEILLP